MGSSKSKEGVPGPVPSDVFWVVLQTGDEILHISALEADLVDRREQGEPRRSTRVAGEQRPNKVPGGDEDSVSTHLLTKFFFWSSL